MQNISIPKKLTRLKRWRAFLLILAFSSFIAGSIVRAYHHLEYLYVLPAIASAAFFMGAIAIRSKIDSLKK